MYINTLNTHIWKNINIDCFWWKNMIDFPFHIFSYMFYINYNKKIKKDVHK